MSPKNPNSNNSKNSKNQKSLFVAMLSSLMLSSLLVTNAAFASIISKTVEYTANGETMESVVFYDDKKKAPMPAIIIVPDWMGVGDFAKNKAKILAKEGYVAYVADVYGKGVRPKNNAEAGKLAGKYMEDRALLRTHIKAGYDNLLEMKEVDPHKVVAMGYCFGGTTVLELARMGTPLVGTATFHGVLSNPNPEDAKNIKGPVLVMHGGEDPHVTEGQVKAFKDEMKKANVDLTFLVYPDAVHAFTNPDAGHDKSTGSAYNAPADKKSWEAFQGFLKKVMK